MAISLKHQQRNNAADLRDTTSPFGVLTFLDWNHAWNGQMYSSPTMVRKAISALAEAGVKMVRQVISWDEVETKQNIFDYSKYDVIVDSLKENQVCMLGILCYTALWTGKQWNDAPDPQLFTTYVRNTVRRYKDRIKYWEIWNEPDHPTYWKDQDGLKAYAELIKVVHPVIKEEDSTAQVVLGSVCSAKSLAQMYKQGVHDYFDVVNVHPFTSPLEENCMKKVHAIYEDCRATMAFHDDEKKPMWFTEIGCPGVGTSQESKGWWLGKSPTDLEQANWLTTVYAEGLKWPGVERIFWAFLQETQHFGDDVDSFGLLKKDFTPKPALIAYRKAADAWASKK